MEIKYNINGWPILGKYVGLVEDLRPIKPIVEKYRFYSYKPIIDNRPIVFDDELRWWNDTPYRTKQIIYLKCCNDYCVNSFNVHEYKSEGDIINVGNQCPYCKNVMVVTFDKKDL